MTFNLETYARYFKKDKLYLQNIYPIVVLYPFP